MGFNDEGGGSFDGLTPEEQQRFKDRVKSIAQGYAEALKLYEDLFKDLDDNGDPTTSPSGAIKGASQESIDLLAGQTNAVRVKPSAGNRNLAPAAYTPCQHRRQIKPVSNRAP